MLRSITVLVRASAILAGLLGAAVAPGCASETEQSTSPATRRVNVVEVTRTDLPIETEAVGSLDGYINAEIRARVRGYVRAQTYRDGTLVEAGQELFRLEDAEYRAALVAARASLARAQATQKRARVQLSRDYGLFQSGAISREQLDDNIARAAESDADVEAARAQIVQARLNLSYTRVRSPIAGVAGLAQVRVGNLVGQEGPTLLTTVSRVDPIRVNFQMSELDYVRYPGPIQELADRDLAWVERQLARSEEERAAEGVTFSVELLLADGSVYPRRGLIVAAERGIDPSTGTVQLQALVQNPERVLRPGQFVRVRMGRPNEGRQVIAVPERALVSLQGKTSVAVVGRDNKVQMRRVEPGPSARNQRVIHSGLRDGERVVVEGLQQISEGSTVDPRPVAGASAATGGQSGANPARAQ